VASKILTTDEQIRKLEIFKKLADSAAKSDSLATRIGACTIYAGLVEFQVIQAGRLLEQILLKEQVHRGKPPSFSPNEDSFFMKNRL